MNLTAKELPGTSGRRPEKREHQPRKTVGMTVRHLDAIENVRHVHRLGSFSEAMRLVLDKGFEHMTPQESFQPESQRAA